jgi:hypothetical protein
MYSKSKGITKTVESTAENQQDKPTVLKNKMQTLCTTCGINRVETECHKLATAVLPCNHEVSWTCGDEDDPRQSSNACQVCIIDQWTKLKEMEPSLKEIRASMRQNLLACMIQLVTDSGEVSGFKQMPLPEMDLHVKCQKEIIDSYLNYAKKNGIQIPKPPANSLIDLKFYETVFAVADLEFSVDEKVGSYFKAVDTVYGRGCKLIKLDRGGLSSCTPNSDGLISIIIGSAFRNNALTDSEPFSAACIFRRR